MPTLHRHRISRRPQITECYALIPIAVARHIIDETSRWLDEPLPARYAAALAFRAHRCYAHSTSFRKKIRRPGDSGRDWLYINLRHWLAARLYAERFELYCRLPENYASGAPLPTVLPLSFARQLPLSPEARQLAPF
jgi:hypothetical protein